VSGEALVFWIFAGLTLGSAFVVVLSRTLIYSAFALLVTFFGVAGLYVLLGADFLAATQLLVYVGGILVLLLFGVMLTHRIYDLDLRSRPSGRAWRGCRLRPRRRSAGCSCASTCCRSRPPRCCCWSR